MRRKLPIFDVQEAKQKGEYAASLLTQVEAKAKDFQQAEKSAREARADSQKLATALADAELKGKVDSHNTRCLPVQSILRFL
jgi:hypothetical protein